MKTYLIKFLLGFFLFLYPVYIFSIGPYGINNWYWNSSEINTRFMNAGMLYARVIVAWDECEPTNNNFNWGPLDDDIDPLRTGGFLVTLALWDDSNPSWALQDPRKQLSYRPEECAEFVYRMLQHCEQRAPGLVVSVEWNELPTGAWVDDIDINITNGTDQRDPSVYYADILKAVYQSVQNFNTTYSRNVLVVTDSIWRFALHHLDELYQLGCKNYFDRINFHYYTEMTSGNEYAPDVQNVYHFITTLKYLRYIADKWGDTGKKIWCTEFGWRYSGETNKANWNTYVMDTCRRSGYVDMVQPYVGSYRGYYNSRDTMALIYDTTDRGIIETEAYNSYRDFSNTYPSWTNPPETLTPLPAATTHVFIINSGFEKGTTDGWGSTDNALTVDTEYKASGNYSGKIISGKSVWTNSYDVEPSKLYEVKFKVKIDAPSYDSAMLSFSLRYTTTGSDVWVNHPNYSGIVKTDRYPGGWRTVLFPEFTPSNARKVSLNLTLNGNGTLWIDDLQIISLTFSTEPVNVQAFPVLQVNENTIDFGDVFINRKKKLSFDIYNAGDGILTGTVSSDVSWLLVSPSEFTTDYKTTIDITADNKILQQSTGTFTGNIYINSNGGNHTITAKLTASCVLAVPNPFNPEKEKVKFTGNGIVPANTEINIYTLSGELVKKIDKIELYWDGTDEKARKVRDGIYLYTYITPKEKGTGKLTLIRKK